jgi:hypothetical protein
MPRVMMLKTVELPVDGGGKVTYPAGHLHLVDDELADQWCNGLMPVAVREDAEDEVNNG